MLRVMVRQNALYMPCDMAGVCRESKSGTRLRPVRVHGIYAPEYLEKGCGEKWIRQGDGTGRC